jgi:serine/threonine protein kinase
MSDPQTHATFLAPEIEHLAPLFPGYEIETLIATGGMGAVYRAVQKSLDRTVAIKILPREFSNDAAFCEGFEAEAKAMARLNHPNLIGVYDFGEVDGMLYIIMEYVPGKSLFHSAHGIAIDANEVIRLVTGICNGLAHAHENGILHRDIKPSNILLDLNAQPKIGDFGLARPIERKIQEGEEIFGTPHYTAPEVVNSPQSVGYRADIFSVGVMLHELLTGRLPADDRRPASAIVHCDPRFDAIIRRATNPLPEARYASAAEIAKDLSAIAGSTGPRVLRTAVANTPARPIPGRSMPVAKPKSSSAAPVIVLLLAAAVIAALALQFLSKPDDSPPAPVKPPDVTSSQPPDENPPPPPPKPETTPKPNPTPDTTDDQKPDTQITKTPEPEPAPDETTPSPEPEPDPAEPATPKFDVAGFFERARKIMQDRATPLIATRDENLVKNLADFERGIKRQIRKLDSGRFRDRAEETLEEFMQTCRENGNHLPEKLDKNMDDLRGVEEVHEEFFQKQEAIDSLLMKSLMELGDLYVIGLEKQIERLKPSDDSAAIALIEEEIGKTRANKDYFPCLMLGIDPDELEKSTEEPKKPDAD